MDPKILRLNPLMLGNPDLLEDMNVHPTANVQQHNCLHSNHASQDQKPSPITLRTSGSEAKCLEFRGKSLGF